jgi:hypothetical protein
MYKSSDIIEAFIGIAINLKQNQLTINSPLEEVILRSSGASLAYIDDRKKAREEYGFDFWDSVKKQCQDSGEDFASYLRTQNLDKRFLYSRSQQFPDFIFKVREQEDKLACGSLLELKDSKGGNIASFNSTLPTKSKSLGELDIINNKSLVSKISSIMDGEFASNADYYNFQRRSFYFIRTHKDDNKVKLSIIDGSFFETIPKDHLIYQMFLNILKNHLEKENIEIPVELVKQVENSLSYITDQTIIAASQAIESASIRPRLRIMAEVHTEGNPHSSHYPEILENSFNLILDESTYENKIEEMIKRKLPDVKRFIIRHKRNGNHVVFQFKM